MIVLDYTSFLLLLRVTYFGTCYVAKPMKGSCTRYSRARQNTTLRLEASYLAITKGSGTGSAQEQSASLLVLFKTEQLATCFDTLFRCNDDCIALLTKLEVVFLTELAYLK